MMDEAGIAGDDRRADEDAASENAGVSEMIRYAERHILAGEYSVALERLMEAKRSQPGNVYIQAIIERVESLRKEARRLTSESKNLQSGSPAGSNRYLSVTVGNQYEEGVRTDAEEPLATEQGVEATVRHLTAVARELFEQGSYESAFQSLMKAYMLDPTSTSVLECEKTLLPAWDMLHKREMVSMPGASVQEPASSPTPLINGSSSPKPSRHPGEGAGPEKTQQQNRLEELMRQKEIERREHERAMWREASRPPKNVDGIGSEDQPAGNPALPPGDKKQPTGFFSRIKRNRLLG